MVEPKGNNTTRYIPDLHVRNGRIIEFPTGNETRGFHTLMLSGAPLKVIEKNKYLVSDVHCAILNQKGINYNIVRNV